MDSKTRVLLIGSGGVGTIAALSLQHGNFAEVSCVLRSNFSAVKEKGFEINSCDFGFIQSWRPTHLFNLIPKVAHNEEKPFEYIVISTKNIPDAHPSLCQLIASAVTPRHSVIVLIQNGLNIERQFLSLFPDNIVLSGVSRIDAHETSPGVIEQKERDYLRIGFFDNPRLDRKHQKEAADHFIRMYNGSGRNSCFYEPDVLHDRWRKLVYNAAFNPICALTGVNTGDLCLSSNATDSLLIPAMREVVSVSRARGIFFPENIIDETLRSIEIEKKISPSMQKDMEKGNLIEHEILLGEVVREAQASGVSTPTLATLYALCSVVQDKIKRAKYSL